MSNPQDELESLKVQVAALTARIYKLEQRTGITPEPRPAAAAAPPQPAVTASAQPSTLPAAAPPGLASVSSPSWWEKDGLEANIGRHWLNRIGIIAILIGVSYFLKYAFDNNWIGPSGRIAIGLIAGIAVILWSESFRSKGYKVFSYSLKAVGIGTLYLSLWAAFQLYHLLPSAAVFIAMIVVTAATITL